MEADQIESIPPSLRSRKQWVMWSYEEREGNKRTKVPYQPNGRAASHNDPRTWSSFDVVAANRGSFDGIGFVFTASDPFCGVDLDKCFSDDGTLLAWAVDIVATAQECECYIERTPSGLGLHIIGTGKLPGRGRKVTGLGDNNLGAVEVYDQLRYFTMTGEQTDIGDVSGDAGPLLGQLWHRFKLTDEDAEPVDPGVDVSDARANELTQAMLTTSSSSFLSLWKGLYETREYDGDRSKARMSLLTKVAMKLVRDGKLPTVSEVKAVALRSPFIRDEMTRERNYKWPRLANDECTKAVEVARKNTAATAAGSEPTPAPNISATVFELRDPKKIEPRDWLYKRIFIRGYVTGTFAPGAAAKTQITLIDLVAIACGFDLETRTPFKRGPLTVWYINVEDDRIEIERRIAGICLHYNVTNDDLGGRLHVDTDRAGRFIVAEQTRDGVVVRKAVVEALLQEVSARAIDLVVVDPLVGMHGVPENANVEMNKVIAQLRHVAEEGRCGVHTIHHVRKGGDEDVSADDGRGASAIKDACRAIRTITPMSEKEADTFGIDRAQRRFYVWSNPSGKPNLAPPIQAREWFFLTDVCLGNARGHLESDHIGVPVAWEPPDAMDGIGKEDARRVWLQIGKASDPVNQTRASVQSNKKWAGNVVATVLKLDINDARTKNRVIQMIKGWVQSRALEEYEVDDEKGNPRPCLRPGPAASEPA